MLLLRLALLGEPAALRLALLGAALLREELLLLPLLPLATLLGVPEDTNRRSARARTRDLRFNKTYLASFFARSAL